DLRKRRDLDAWAIQELPQPTGHLIGRRNLGYRGHLYLDPVSTKLKGIPPQPLRDFGQCSRMMCRRLCHAHLRDDDPKIMASSCCEEDPCLRSTEVPIGEQFGRVKEDPRLVAGLRLHPMYPFNFVAGATPTGLWPQ